MTWRYLVCQAVQIWVQFLKIKFLFLNVCCKPGPIWQSPRVKQDTVHHPKPTWTGTHIKAIELISLGREEEGNCLEWVWCLHTVTRKFYKSRKLFGVVITEVKFYGYLDLTSAIREVRIGLFSDIVFYTFVIEKVLGTGKCKEVQVDHSYHQKYPLFCFA